MDNEGSEQGRGREVSSLWRSQRDADMAGDGLCGERSRGMRDSGEDLDEVTTTAA
jgi:hypothetical protein